MAGLANNLAVIIGIPFYLFGFAVSAILTLISVIQYFNKKNWKGFLLFLASISAIILANANLGEVTALKFTAVLIAVFTLKILFSAQPSKKTLLICGAIILYSSLSFILADNIYRQNEQALDDVILFIFIVMAPVILARLAHRSFPQTN